MARLVDAQRAKGHLDQNAKAAIAHAFQTAVLKTLLAQTDRAIQMGTIEMETLQMGTLQMGEKALPPDRTSGRRSGRASGEKAGDASRLDASRLSRCVLAGGVAANLVLQAGLEALCRRRGLTLFYPELAYCTDNAAMIGWAALERAEAGLIGPSPLSSSDEARRVNEADSVAVDPRLPLDPLEPTRHQKLVEARRAARHRRTAVVSKKTPNDTPGNR